MNTMEKPMTNGIEKAWLPIQASRSARNTINPIRRIVDRMKINPNPAKEMISLSIGDPTHYGNMLPPLEALEGILQSVQLPTSHGYVPSFGTLDARKAVAQLWSRSNYTLKPENIILTSGCSHALEICIKCLADPGDNILLPRPGFSLYITLCESLDIEIRFYDLIPEENWQINLTHLESLIDDRTRTIIINNPSNPCGAVYSEEHLRNIIHICERHHLPIIADEIYADMVFSNQQFHFLAMLSENVPILSCGGMAKRFICPGWRIGWIVIHDRHNLFKDTVQPGLLDLSSLILGPNSVTQAALPYILSETPDSYFMDILNQLRTNAEYFYNSLVNAPGLQPTMPQGAMYMLIRMNPSDYNDIENDKEFFTKLLCEESISCLPASVFGIDNFIRIVLTTPTEKAEEACHRILEFCRRHAKSIT
ncbi:unnamed protein product [Rotaria sordida]|uniref:Tyrosine aminotransferase n=1 Tax=Rotaria sordida TaxID=392033 RepID=A0A815DZK4_9BILA|nr:unnamed protein product [Rotaria sordida]CAF1304188.1 unnamed protein product [Rotaria sordida]CAF1304688.1 unnamed protein product [Rotaria sordida]CAF3947170.1 unnamed protein product [Rotaria sordida]